MATTVALVQRHTGERTQAVGLRLAAEQLPFEGIESVTAVAFPMTLRRALEAAVSMGADWTIMLDADVLVLPGSLPKLLRLASEYPDHHASLNACCFDRLTATVRPVGLRCYRTSLIPKALRLEGWEEMVRPESALLSMMGDIGHPTSITALLAGVHDFEQYYRDLYRTAVVHGVKFRTRGADRNIERWVAAGDMESLVLVTGARHGLTLDEVTLDAEQFHDAAAAALEKIGLSERLPLASTEAPDVRALLDPRHEWLTRSTSVTRNLPDLVRKIAHKPDQPRRLRIPRLLLQHRRRLLRRAPIKPMIRWRGSR